MNSNPIHPYELGMQVLEMAVAGPTGLAQQLPVRSVFGDVGSPFGTSGNRKGEGN